MRDGSKLGPDAARLSTAKLRSFSRDERSGFLPVAPEFIIELRSRTDRLRSLHRKMVTWMANGVELAWLIDADNRRVWVYTAGGDMRALMEPATLAAAGPVAGFELELEEIYRGLDL